MTSHQAIGGYYELELPQKTEFHPNAIALNTARNCLEYILLARGYKKVYIPRYTCEVILEPFAKHGIEYEFYPINDRLEPQVFPDLQQSEAFLYTNYYGLKQNEVRKLAERYGDKIIIDNAQAFYAPPVQGVDTFYSPRKFFGVPDGGYLYTTATTLTDLPRDISWPRMQQLLQRIDESAEVGYHHFRKNSEALVNAPILRMSKLTQRILRSIDYEQAKAQRLRNYHTLHRALNSSNLLQIEPNSDDVPMVYPFLTTNTTLRQRLINNRIFVATYWPNVLQWSPENSTEYTLTKQLLPLPIDQRYNTSNMNRVLNSLLTLI